MTINNTTPPTTPWWNDFFDDNFSDLLLDRDDPTKLAQDIDFIIHELQLERKHVVFDQCCGTGEIAIGLAKREIGVIGVDQCERYIDRAKIKSIDNALLCDFHLADALEFICPRQVDAGLNWYTSFGYSDDDRVNIKMFKNNFNSLKTGGRFILDYSNPAYVFSNFEEHKTLTKASADGERVAHKTSRVDFQRGMFISRWEYISPQGEIAIKTGESRIYFARELTDMLIASGFTIIGLNGDTSGRSLSKDSPRCIITAQKG